MNSTEVIAPSRPGWLLAGCCLAAASRFIEPPAWLFYPPDAAPFGAGWTAARLLSSLWGLVTVILLVTGGLLGDRFGRRRLLMAGLAVTVVANVLLMTIDSNVGHIIMRIVTQCGGALVLPLALAPLYIFYRGKARVQAFAWYALVTTLASVLASLQASLLVSVFGWRGAYLASICLALLALAIIFFTLPESHLRLLRNPTALFYAGWSLLVLAAAYGLIHIGLVRDWQGPALAVAVVAGALGLSLVLRWDIQTPGRLWDDTSLKTRDLTVLIGTGVAIQFVLTGFFLPTLRYFNVVQGFGLLTRVLAITPLLVGMLVGLRLAGRIWKGQSARRVLVIGLALASLCVVVMAIRPDAMPYLVQIAPLAVFGFSILSTKTVWTNAFYQTVVDDYVGLNAGINGAALQLGGVLGGVVGGQLVVLFGYRAFEARLAPFFGIERTGQLYEIVAQAPSRDSAITDLALPALGGVVWNQYVASYSTAYALTLLVIAGFALLSAVLAFVGLRKGVRYTAEAPVVDTAASVFERPALWIEAGWRRDTTRNI